MTGDILLDLTPQIQPYSPGPTLTELTLINPFEPERLAARKRAKHLCQQLNNLRADQRKARQLLYAQLFAEARLAWLPWVTLAVWYATCKRLPCVLISFTH